jgi:glutathionyl-hydroquinone reductase
MENATKALIMVGAILLAMLILAVGLYLHGRLGQTADSYTTKLDTVELQKYNNLFEVYMERDNITAQEIITTVGVAKQKEQGTKVYLKTEDITDMDENKKNEFLSNNILTYKPGDVKENLYKCTSIEYDEKGKVIKIVFEKR